ncbi:DUF1684 domain-containing protein [Aquiflexum gelatinilyticum]|uniref:DUF1684 domain-containing protein n=1 Tax=Aquiflexum gelatinilyticum TaxID=2961943 RepID=A0A9X2P1M7_9BACT|nr:DUF1684 domain-containing protein [Aquiflexum gelatinilyticum]MCR9013631.1 DUF1684 domain-containing protein [Aquiflexum gelatinilyticum]
MKLSRFLLILAYFTFVLSCGKKESQINPEEHAAEVEAWYQDRVNSVKSEEGWLNLIGLHWLDAGETTFGTGAGSRFRLESQGFPDSIGVFFLEEGKVYFTPQTDSIFLGENELKEKVKIFDVETQEFEKLSFKSLRWNIIKRADAYGVRLRDLETAAVTQFEGIKRYPIDLEWRLEAKFIPYSPIREIPITNVLGQTTPNPSPGYLEFQKDGITYKIDALDAEDELYLIIADNTSGGETYGGGRYMYVKKPVSGDIVILDFNKAYNPPCVFTPHATCPLPPRQNMLDLAITAGEKTFGEH